MENDLEMKIAPTEGASTSWKGNRKKQKFIFSIAVIGLIFGGIILNIMVGNILY
jgi:hypothetical protein